jgi:DNA-directed RNA polymerase subunit RPC12/RpoP
MWYKCPWCRETVYWENDYVRCPNCEKDLFLIFLNNKYKLVKDNGDDGIEE